MIKRIKRIKKFGIFHDFRWYDNLPEFDQFNLIYGWNYSGKTTLSRVFQTLEKKKLNAAYAEAHFQLLTEDGSEVSSADLSVSPTVRVFNRDYVEANFTEDYAAPSIFIVGEKNIELEEQLEQLIKRRTRFEKYEDNFLKKKESNYK